MLNGLSGLVIDMTLRAHDCNLDEVVSVPNGAGEHADTVQKPPAIGGMMNSGRHTRRLSTQFASLRHPCLGGPLHHALMEAPAPFRDG
jgi:hypothetical protein